MSNLPEHFFFLVNGTILMDAVASGTTIHHRLERLRNGEFAVRGLESLTGRKDNHVIALKPLEGRDQLFENVESGEIHDVGSRPFFEGGKFVPFWRQLERL